VCAAPIEKHVRSALVWVCASVCVCVSCVLCECVCASCMCVSELCFSVGVCELVCVSSPIKRYVRWQLVCVRTCVGVCAPFVMCECVCMCVRLHVCE
jgi:hypothetical protein